MIHWAQIFIFQKYVEDHRTSWLELEEPTWRIIRLQMLSPSFPSARVLLSAVFLLEKIHTPLPFAAATCKPMHWTSSSSWGSRQQKRQMVPANRSAKEYHTMVISKLLDDTTMAKKEPATLKMTQTARIIHTSAMGWHLQFPRRSPRLLSQVKKMPMAGKNNKAKQTTLQKKKQITVWAGAPAFHNATTLSKAREISGVRGRMM